MIHAAIARRLAGLALHPETVAALQVVAQDADDLLHHPPIAATFALLPPALGGSEELVAPFRAAWALMYAVIGRLDSLQDGDPLRAIPEICSPAAQYNLVFAGYLLATSLLDELAALVPPARLIGLQRWWVDCMLRMADGQQRDLAGATGPASFEMLADYQQIAQAKTGATYALACGGLALLLSDDLALATALAQVGEIYGSLVQYADDLHDAAAQPNATLTLPTLLRHLPLTPSRSPAQVEAAFWAYLFPYYQQAALTALAGYPTLHGPISELFARGFAAPRAAQ